MNRLKVKSLLYAPSALMMGYLTALIFFALERIQKTGNSRDFLQHARFWPTSGGKIVAAVFLIAAAFMLIEAVLENANESRRRKPLLLAGLLAELGLCVAANYYLCCSFRGAVYLVVANVLICPMKNWERLAWIVLASLCYVAIDVNMGAERVIPYGMNTLMRYMGDSAVAYSSVTSLLRTFSDVAFIFFCLVAMSAMSGEKQRIEALNNQLRLTVDELHVSNIQLRQQARHDEEFAIYKERLRFSREMHDIIGHVLTGLTVGLKACDALLCENQPLSRQLSRLSDLASKGLNELRNAINDTRMSAEDSYSLVEDVNELITSIAECVPVDIRLEIAGRENMRLDSIQENVVYRVLQESVTNAVRHAHARRLDLALRFGEADVTIEAVNDGEVSASIREGMGLKSMRERATMLGGRMEAGVDAKGRFHLKVEFPVAREENDENSNRG